VQNWIETKMNEISDVYKEKAAQRSGEP
jgi:hypothetical protein